jgi:23S rRNA pseudouridine2605 synthase
MEERLQKYLANAGVASRRKCEELILEGKVKVNGKVVTELGTKVTDKDKVEYNGRVVKPENKKVYILLNKPIGYVTTVKDQFDRPTVMELIKEKDIRVVPVGRLDMYTSGALILSNDGDFINKVTHPKNEIEKTYNVTLAGKITEDDVNKLKNGVEIEANGKQVKTSKAKVKILKIDDEKNISRVRITIHEGKNREIRKMCEAIGKKVLALHRAQIGNLDVKDLKIGDYKYLTKKDLQKIC